MSDIHQQFDERAYLAANPDVADAVARGAFASGQMHYDLIGRKSGRPLRDGTAAPEPKVKIGDHCIVYQPALLAKRIKGPHTFIVGGASRNDASSVGFMLHHQGIDMGAPAAANCEDPVFVKSISREKFDTQAVADRIAARNAERDVWGVRLPEAVFHFMRLEEMTRNPVFIMSYHNPVSVARSMMRGTDMFAHDADGLSRALCHAAGFYGPFSERLAKLKSPVICLEYEQILFHPEAALTEILTTIGVTPSNMAELVDNILGNGGVKRPALRAAP